MKLYSTNNKAIQVDLKEAVLKSLAKDKGLYMPISIPKLEEGFIKNLDQYTLPEIGFHVCATLFDDYVPAKDLMQILNDALTFPAPVVNIHDELNTLELFHGPSLAFKDFGARFMAQLMGYFNRGADKKLTILVATSGDTGGAVASGFYKTEGVEVIILYPKGKVSHIQEQQLTTLGENIYACEIDGTFDDCQSMVKTAFLDEDFSKQYNLSSANSINIARLIPQSFYYFDAVRQLESKSDIVIAVPSGNFGNLTAGLIAKEMGLPVKRFIAATNINRVVPDFLSKGSYEPVPSKSTLANAMDVGNPSNFVRMQELYNKDVNLFRKQIIGDWYTDEAILDIITKVDKEHQYILDPHGAIGYLACEKYLAEFPNDTCVFLETAHPCKFIDTVEKALDRKIAIPDAVKGIIDKKKVATPLNNYSEFKDWLLSR